MKVDTVLEVGLKHVFILFLKIASKWQLFSSFENKVVQRSFLLKSQRYEVC